MNVGIGPVEMIIFGFISVIVFGFMALVAWASWTILFKSQRPIAANGGQQSHPQLKKCPGCGAQIALQYSFCPDCGLRVST